MAFLPRSRHLLISWLQSPSAVILEPPKIKSVTVSTVSPSVCHEVMVTDHWLLRPIVARRFFGFLDCHCWGGHLPSCMNSLYKADGFLGWLSWMSQFSGQAAVGCRSKFYFMRGLAIDYIQFLTLLSLSWHSWQEAPYFHSILRPVNDEPFLCSSDSWPRKLSWSSCSFHTFT